MSPQVYHPVQGFQACTPVTDEESLEWLRQQVEARKGKSMVTAIVLMPGPAERLLRLAERGLQQESTDE